MSAGVDGRELLAVSLMIVLNRSGVSLHNLSAVMYHCIVGELFE